MKSKRESANRSEANHKQEKEIAEAADFDSKRMHQIKKIEIKRES